MLRIPVLGTTGRGRTPATYSDLVRGNMAVIQAEQQQASPFQTAATLLHRGSAKATSLEESNRTASASHVTPVFESGTRSTASAFQFDEIPPYESTHRANMQNGLLEDENPLKAGIPWVNQSHSISSKAPRLLRSSTRPSADIAPPGWSFPKVAPRPRPSNDPFIMLKHIGVLLHQSETSDRCDRTSRAKRKTTETSADQPGAKNLRSAERDPLDEIMDNLRCLESGNVSSLSPDIVQPLREILEVSLKNPRIARRPFSGYANHQSTELFEACLISYLALRRAPLRNKKSWMQPANIAVSVNCPASGVVEMATCFYLEQFRSKRMKIRTSLVTGSSKIHLE